MFHFLILMISTVVSASAAQLSLKKGLSSLGGLDFSLTNLFHLIPRILQNGWVVAGMILYGISFLLYIFTLSKAQLNIIYPIFASTGIIIVSLASCFFLKEPLSWLQILGIIIIIFGIFLLATKG